MAVDAQGESGRSLFTKSIVNIPPVNIVALVNMFISDRGFLDKVVLTFETWQEGPFDRDPFILAVATPCKVDQSQRARLCASDDFKCCIT